MKSLYAPFAVLLLLTSSFVFAQTKVQVSIPDVTIDNRNNFCIPVVADSFPMIAGVQFAVEWDSTVLSFTGVDFGDNPVGITEGSTARPADFRNNFGVTYITSDLSGVTLPSGTTILEICFDPIGENGTYDVTFDGYLPPEFIQENAAETFPHVVFPGSVTIDAPVSIREPDWAADFSVFPNPVNGDDFAIRGRDLPRLESITLGDFTGRIVRTLPGTARTVSVANLPAGTYWLQLLAADGVVSRRIIVE